MTACLQLSISLRNIYLYLWVSIYQGKISSQVSLLENFIVKLYIKLSKNSIKKSEGPLTHTTQKALLELNQEHITFQVDKTFKSSLGRTKKPHSYFALPLCDGRYLHCFAGLA